MLPLGSIFTALLAFSCSSDDASTRDAPRTKDPGQVVSVSLAAETQAALDDIERERKATSSMGAQDLLDKYPAPFANSLPYNPLDAMYLDSIVHKYGALPQASKTVLANNGFVIRENQSARTFGNGYYEIFEADLPVFVSADAILEAVYRSHQAILKSIESGVLLPAIKNALQNIRTGLQQGNCSGFSPSTCADIDEYIAVALSLAQGSYAEPVQGGDGHIVQSLVDDATKASGLQTFVLFGTERVEDMSQFKPRGHYTKSAELSQYFRAMMWLGRVDMRLIETLEDGSQVFRPRSVEAMFALRKLIDQPQLAAWGHIDDVLRTFVSEQDNMTLAQVDDLLRDLGQVTPENAATMDPSVLATAIAQGGYGQQRIASSVIINHSGSELPLSASFRLMGQRFTVDSQVFSQVTWARTQAMRMMPSPFDAAFGAWGNHGAAQLLLPELQTYSYAPNLHLARYVATKHAQPFWQSGLYHGWLGALSGLNPSPEEVGAPLAAGLPSVAGTEAWNRRILNTQLASWSQLKHNAVLYAKQGFTDGAGCSFPDAYVDPYPEFYERIGQYAQRGIEMTAAFTSAEKNASYGAESHYTRLANVAAKLHSIATDQRNGISISSDDLSWLNGMIGIGPGYGIEEWNGWYADLFVDKNNAQLFEPSIVDVHTQPTDAGGNVVGNVLHVGTGEPKLIIVTVDTGASGPRAFAGYVSSFHEHITSDFERLTDEEWKGMVATHPAPSWMTGIMVP